jgi:hypothetical protein
MIAVDVLKHQYDKSVVQSTTSILQLRAGLLSLSLAKCDRFRSFQTHTAGLLVL